MSTVLLIGSGGREHAMAWKLSRSPKTSRLIVCPGGDGMKDLKLERWEWPKGSTHREIFRALAKLARAEGVKLTVVGPDNPLADGLVDEFEGEGLLCFGPRAAAARLESSKAFAKEVMKASGVPTAEFRVAQSLEEARKILKSVKWPKPGTGGGWVVKADGLALGKGVEVCSTPEAALAAAERLGNAYKSSEGEFRLVIEERLKGEELSWLAFCDGTRCALLDPARDHKRLSDRDQGPNTGGMGAVSPVAGLPPGLEERVKNEVFLPVLSEMKKRGTPFQGILYAGLMVDGESGRYGVIEFNARFGDPEAQVLLPRMKDDLYDWCEAVARGDLSNCPPRVPFNDETAVVVVAAAEGYPESPKKGAKLALREPVKSSELPAYFFAGVKSEAGSLQTSGGRVYGAMGMGRTLADAQTQAYQRIEALPFQGMIFRRDIGGKRP
jgi:phosphoribosylamine--glycine ligase